jgi:diguanylate cyclase (GGDEF)-like protein/PAS domain S-box-containing protein
LFQISQKLYIRVALAIALISIVISLIASALTYYFGLEDRQKTNYLLAEQLSKTVEKTAVIAAYVNDNELAQEIVNGLVINGLVKGVTINNDVGLAAIAGEFTDKDKHISTILNHPFLAEVEVGRLNVYLDQKFIELQTKRYTQKEILVKLLLSLIVAFFVSLLVHRKLTKPIQKLIDSFEHIDPNNPKTMVMLPHKGNDELGKLVKGVNTLMHGLHHSFNVEKDLRIKTQYLETRFRLIFEQASAGICLLDEQDNIVTYNPAFSKYFTTSGARQISSTHFPTLMTNTTKIQELLSSLRTDSNLGQVALDLEYQIGNQQRWMHCLFAKVTEQRTQEREDNATIIEIILYDITERTEREHQTRFEADHDPLTHLFNRRAGEENLENMLVTSIKNQQPLMLMMIDLDKFKPINDTYGHEAGDAVLSEIANRIRKQYASENDVCIRWGGDEFVIAGYTNECQSTIKHQAETLLESIQQPIKIQSNVSCNVSASIGLVIAPEHGSVLHELLTRADNAMYQVKDLGRSSVEFYTAK